jgi:hypothetical protein
MFGCIPAFDFYPSTEQGLSPPENSVETTKGPSSSPEVGTGCAKLEGTT